MYVHIQTHTAASFALFGHIAGFIYCSFLLLLGQKSMAEKCFFDLESEVIFTLLGAAALTSYNIKVVSITII